MKPVRKITPPTMSMAIALRDEIKNWWPRVQEKLQEAKAHHDKQQKEVFEGLLTDAGNDYERGRIANTFTPKPFNPPEEHQLQIDTQTAIEILRQMFRTWISTRSCFEPNDYGSLDWLLSQKLAFYTSMGSDSDYYSGLFYNDVIDPVLIEIRDLLSPEIEENTWDVWSIYVVGRGQFIVQNDGDFRVAEWTEMVGSGLIDCPTKRIGRRELPKVDEENRIDAVVTYASSNRIR